MENLLSLLPLLACPLMMGGMMWMMRGRPGKTSGAPSPTETSGHQMVPTTYATKVQPAQPGPSMRRPARNVFGLCLNWQVVGALGMVALAIWVVAPSVLGAALPVLVLAACPLSMLLMMRGTQGTQCAPQSTQISESTGPSSTREDRLADLQGRLASVRAEEDVLAGEITTLEREPTSVERQAEAAARGAGGRGAS